MGAPKKRPRGRPLGSGIYYAQFYIRITPELHAIIKRETSRSGESIGAFFRRAARYELERLNAYDEAQPERPSGKAVGKGGKP